jgi:hypothetical protein
MVHSSVLWLLMNNKDLIHSVYIEEQYSHARGFRIDFFIVEDCLILLWDNCKLRKLIKQTFVWNNLFECVSLFGHLEILSVKMNHPRMMYIL